MTISLLIIAIVAVQQLGLFNTCFCFSGAVISGALRYVDLTAVTRSVWIDERKTGASALTVTLLLNVAFISVAELFYSDS
jgi:hypothetical protein